jgi:hypothetical protein
MEYDLKAGDPIKDLDFVGPAFEAIFRW